MKPYEFWSQLLKNSEEIHWTELTKKLIYTILVLPVGSAEAERGFSIMNHIKSSRRARLNEENLGHSMRIRINGPDAEDFSAFKYAKQWLDEGHLRIDSKMQVAKKVEKDDANLLNFPLY